MTAGGARVFKLDELIVVVGIFVHVVVNVAVVIVANPVGDPVGGKRRRRLERLAFAALSARQEVHDVTSRVQTGRPSVGKPFTDAVLTHDEEGGECFVPQYQLFNTTVFD